jgi:3-phenylpropionate/cinnamic acid dioxygenase small subunit
MTVEQRPSTKSPVDRHEIENFLYREARLIDEDKLDEWLALFVNDSPDEIIYWVPCNRDNIDPLREVSFIYDNRAHLEDRVWRLQSGLAHTMDPRPRIRHVVSNIELEAAGGDELTVHSTVLVFHFRKDKEKAFVGACLHRLRRVGGEWRIAFKKVDLLNNDGIIDSMQLLI